MSVNVGTLSAELDLNGDPFERSLDRAMASGAQRAERMGQKMTMGVTLPLVAAGTAAVSMGMDFDTSMSRITGLVGLSAGEVDSLRQGVLDLAGETAKAPQELADALFTVTSAGFRGAEAMSVLEAASKASAAGLGETRTIAEALTGAINAYGPEVLDAAQATDILVATARAGNFETSQLAGALGQALPWAKQAGAAFEDVGGAVALLTRVNNNASESMTQVTAMLRAFVAPTAEAQKILEGLGMSAQDVRDSIAQDGLVGALQMLDSKLGGNREQLVRVLGSSEAAAAAFQILDADADTLAGTFGTVADSAGMLDEAFGAAAGTDAFRMQQVLAELQTSLIEAGSAIAPFVATVAGGVGTIAEAFSQLPSHAQTALLVFAGFAAAVGPVVTLATNVHKVVGAMRALAASSALAGGGMTALVGSMGAVGALLAVGAGLYMSWANNKAEAARITDLYVDALRAENGALDTNIDKIGATELATKDYASAIRDSGVGFDVLTEAVRTQGGAIETLDDSLAVYRDGLISLDELLGNAGLRGTEFGEALTVLEGVLGRADFMDLINDLDGLSDRHDKAAETAKNLAAAEGDVEGATGDVADAAGDAAPTIEDLAAEMGAGTDEAAELASAIKEVTDALRSQMDPWFAAQDALLNHKDAQDAVKAAQMEALVAQQELDQAIKDHGRESDEAALASLNLAAAQQAVVEADREVVRSALNVSTATAELKMWMEQTGNSVEDAEAILGQWVDQGLITAEQARQVASELRGTAGAAAALDGRNVVIPVQLTGFERTIAQLDELSRRAGQNLLVNASVAARERAVEGRWTGGPVLPDKEYIIGEHGPELLLVRAA